MIMSRKGDPEATPTRTKGREARTSVMQGLQVLESHVIQKGFVGFLPRIFFQFETFFFEIVVLF
jgi:hypothetical protein